MIHPLAELPRPTSSREEYAAAHALDPAKPWIALLPGSRSKEIQLNLPAMLEAADDLSIQGDYEFLIPVASTVSRSALANQLKHWTEPFDRNSAPRRANSHLVPDAREALHHARAGVVASGTG